MTLGVGVIGTGAIGQKHLHRLSSKALLIGARWYGYQILCLPMRRK